MKVQQDENTNAERITKKKKILRGLSRGFYGLSKFMLSIPAFVGKRIGMKDLVCNLLMPFTEAVEDKSNCYVTYNLVPKCANEQNDWLYYASVNSKEHCIVIQGPIAKENDFTLETVKYYGKIYPNVLVIVSTWENEDKQYLKQFESEKNCKVVLNKPPTNPGTGNVNYQILSSLGGVKEAEQYEKKYVLKTRSDMRITAVGVLEILQQYISEYAVADVLREKQKQRLVFFNAFLFHPYHASDFFCFGTTQDIIDYYDVELNQGKRENNMADKMIANQWSYRDLYNNPNGENEICIKYFRKKNGSTKCDLNEWWSVLSQSVVSLPLSILKPIWIKYDYNHEESNFYITFRRKLMGGDKIDNTKVDFSMWLDMYNMNFGLNPEDYEYILDWPMS